MSMLAKDFIEKRNMKELEKEKKAQKLLEKIIKMSFENGWKLHHSLGGTYGEFYVFNELKKHKPKFSSDITLEKTGKRIEVKWGEYHYRKSDKYYNKFDVPFWGWGFSHGFQFLGNRKKKKRSKPSFDYCVLLAANKKKANPKYKFVIKVEEMKKYCKKRKNIFGGETYFIEFSNKKDFFKKRKESKLKMKKIEIEKRLYKNKDLYRKRWKELKKYGKLKSDR